MTPPKETNPPRVVHIVSHGPHCLDGVAAAAAIARYYREADVRPRFSGNSRINEILQGLPLEEPLEGQELWITDISWTAPETDARLRDLARRGLRIYWIDHHRTAIDRDATGRIDVPFAHKIVDDRVAASRLVFEYLNERLAAEGRSNPELARFHKVVEMADDNDRWIHAVDGSWDLALTVRSMNGEAAYEDLVAIDEDVTYTPRMTAAFEKVAGEMKASFEMAEATRTVRDLDSGVRVVGAVCDGYPSEIADRWGREIPNAVFALFDLKSGAVSYRRSPDCHVDLSKVAETFGGGGHPAAAGCEIPELLQELSRGTAEHVGRAVDRILRRT